MSDPSDNKPAKKVKVGLALGAGAARGLAHIGVLEVLEEAGIGIDMIAGTSFGAVVGALFARGLSSKRIHHLAIRYGSKRLGLFEPAISRTGLVGGKGVLSFLNATIGRETTFNDLKIPFACVATDIISGEEVVLKYGSVVKAVRVSLSIPGVFTLVKYQGRYLVDGGLVNPVPVSVAKSMGADFTIAVNAIPDVVDRAQHVLKEHGGHPAEPNIIQIFLQATYIGTYQLARSSMAGADIIIDPHLGQFGSGDFQRAEEIIQQGRNTAARTLPDIEELLERASRGTRAE